MIRNIVQCDRCDKQADLPFYLTGAMQALPDKWFRVTGDGKDKQFCSTNCIKGYFSSNPREYKQTCLEL